MLKHTVSNPDFAQLLTAVTGTAEPDEALEQICLYLERMVPGARTSVLALEGWLLACAAAPGLPAAYARATTGRLLNPAGQSAAIGDDVPALLREIGLRESSSTPILSSQGVLLGMFHAYSQEPLPGATGALLDICAKLAGIVLERRSLEHRLTFEANHDATTGLPNRRRFLELLEGELASRRNERLTVAILDLDRFHHATEAMGQDGGDRLLRYAGERLRSVVGEQGMVARTGSDEFAVAARQRAGEMEDLLHTALCGPFTVSGREMFVTCTAGIASCADDTLDAAALLQNAESALWRARATGPNQVARYRGSRRHDPALDFDIEQELRKALAGSELEVRYQPVVRAGGELVALEALLACGTLAPRDFIRVAEVSGIIVPIGAWVLDHSCIRAAGWNGPGQDRVRLAVNVSAVQFASPEFIRVVQNALDHSGLASDLLELEITESVLMRDVEQSIRRMSELRRIGVRLAIDDFGAGYSSLNYLRLLPATTVKIDQSFVRDLPESSATLTVIRSVVSLAHSLGLDVIAEGVETIRQFDLLRDAGCDCFQGHLLGRPVAASEIEREPFACV